ncbi:MAG: hypothetical protein H7255_09005 [Ramlibacter sp.]|nr:hypothetical protein [Ramlibacter sp.]
MKWSSFTNAIQDLRAWADAARPEYQEEALMLAEWIEQSEKFYMPSAALIIEGRPIDGFKSVLELPFPLISILSDANMRDGDKSPVDIITVAVAASEESASVSGAWAILWSAINRGTGWHPSGAPVLISKPANAVGLEITTNAASPFTALYANEGLSSEFLFREMDRDVVVLTNLCVMLSLKNVRNQTVAAPPALNAKRKKKGKPPLWSYHVLEVDGELWDQPESSGPTDQAYRSHLRRGHIRRLVDGRSVWVRAAYVHGKLDGFVQKDYLVGGPK